MGKVWGTYHRGGISHSTYTWNQPVHWTRRVPGSARPTYLGCPVPLTVRGTQALVSFAPLAFKLFYAARQNAVLRRSSFPSP